MLCFSLPSSPQPGPNSHEIRFENYSENNTCNGKPSKLTQCVKYNPHSIGYVATVVDAEMEYCVVRGQDVRDINADLLNLWTYFYQACVRCVKCFGRTTISTTMDMWVSEMLARMRGDLDSGLC
jgi:hypothetical protein